MLSAKKLETEMTDGFLAGIAAERLIAIVRGRDKNASIATVMTLLEEGYRRIEVTMNTDGALEVIQTVLRQAPAGALIGAGTVLTADDVSRVVDAGAQFAVTPAVVPSIAEAARVGLPIISGALTASESWSAMDQGASAVKLFPASVVGGPAYLKALREPFRDIPFIPVGGVGVAEVAEYLQLGAVAVGLGGPLSGDAADGGDLGALRERARRFREAAAPWQKA